MMKHFCLTPSSFGLPFSFDVEARVCGIVVKPPALKTRSREFFRASPVFE